MTSLLPTILAWIMVRLREATTWGGLISILTSIGIVLSPEAKDAIIQLGLAVAGVLMVVIPEAMKERDE